MTACPDWRALAAHRRDPQAAEPAGWAEALAHFDRCGRCRPAALAADPTLLFRRLRETAPDLGGDDDVAAIRQGVAALRAASRLEGERRQGTPWKRWAAAAALAVAALASGSTRTGGPEGWSAEAGLAPLEPALVAGEVQLPGGQEIRPVVDGVDRPDARVYQMQDEKLSIAMVVHESLEI